MTTSRRFRPAVESLPQRTLPTGGTFTFANGIVNVRGTGGADLIVIEDPGNFADPDGTARLIVSCDGRQVLDVDANAVTGLTVATRGGRDRVVYRLVSLTGTAPQGGPTTTTRGGTRDVTIRLGAGDDSFEGRVLEVAGATMNLTVNGNTGNDELMLGFVSVIEGGQFNATLRGQAGNDGLVMEPESGLLDDQQIGTDSSANLLMRGGTGNDQLRTTFGGQLDGNLTIDQRGRDGDDALFATIILQPSLSTARRSLTVLQFAGPGADNQPTLDFPNPGVVPNLATNTVSRD